MKHLFVPYEIALLLKEKGFDEPCFCYYTNDNEDTTDKNFYLFEYFNSIGITTTQFQSNKGMEDVIAAPLYQQVVDWFREKHDIEIQQGCRIPKEAIKAANGNLSAMDYEYNFYLYRESSNPRILGNSIMRNDYYEALTVAITHALTFITQ